jgi:GntR family transcriptional repressor for pyruvate dehydrogenase complex
LGFLKILPEMAFYNGETAMSDEDKQIFSFSKPVDKQSLVKTVVNRIKEALINRELKAGDALPSENQLAAQLGVGKSVVREAIKMLEAFGVVEVRQGARTVIKKAMSEDSAMILIFQMLTEQQHSRYLVELRTLLEPSFTLLASRKATQEDMDKIEKTLIQLETAIREQRQTVEDDIQFHLEMFKATHNPFVVTIGETLLQLSRPSITYSVKKRAKLALVMHRKIFEAVKSRNEHKINAAVVESFKGWQISLKEEAEDEIAKA